MVARPLTVLDSCLLRLHVARLRRRSDAAWAEDESLGLVLGAVADALADLDSRLDHLAAATGSTADRPGRFREDAGRGGPTLEEFETAAVVAVRPIADALAGAMERLDRIEAALAEAPPPDARRPPDRPLAAARELAREWPSVADPAADPDDAVQHGAPSVPGDQVEAHGRTAAKARARALDLLGVDDGDAEVEIARTLVRLPSRRFLARARVRPRS